MNRASHAGLTVSRLVDITCRKTKIVTNNCMRTNNTSEVQLSLPSFFNHLDLFNIFRIFVVNLGYCQFTLGARAFTVLSPSFDTFIAVCMSATVDFCLCLLILLLEANHTCRFLLFNWHFR